MNKPIVKNMNVYCDKCNHNFKLKPKNIKIEKITESIERTYFKCLKCKEKYIISYLDTEIKENLKRMEVITKEARKKDIDQRELENIQKRFNNLKERNINLSNKYASIFKDE